MALLTVIVLVCSVVAIMLLTPGFDIKKIDVRGNMVLKEQDIIKASGLVTGVNIFSVSLNEAEEAVESVGYVESVKIRRVLPSTVEITVVEEVGVAYLAADNGYIIITADGRCVEKTDAVKKSEDGGQNVAVTPELPKITGVKSVKYKEGNIITSENEKQLEALFACLHEFTKYGYIDQMVEIDVTDISEIEFYYKSKNLRVGIGSANEKLGYKMECFAPIYDYVIEKTKEGEMPSGYVNLERLTYSKNKEAKKPEDTNLQKTQ